LSLNFLAHVYLSGNDSEIIVGNFIGDFVKGKSMLEQYDSGIVKGIELHRSIDDFTDNHPVVTESKKRLYEKYHHYSAVIVDMYYDHLLAHHWSDFHQEPLRVYTLKIYKVLMDYHDILPDEVRGMLMYMMRDNWLLAYSKLEGIHRALSGMSRRTTFQSRMEEAATDLEEHYESFDKEFLTFFPDLKTHAEDFLKSV
jgi:acyl carrier protein phosphodiesterase